MSYGVSITNSSGEVVIDDTNSTFLVDQIVTPSFNATWSYAGVTYYRYPINSARLNLFKLNIGQSLNLVTTDQADPLRTFGQYYYSNSPTIEIAECILAEDLTAPSSGYGFEIFDPNGNPTYLASKDMITFGGQYERSSDTVANISSITTTGGEYFTILATRIANSWTGNFPPNSPVSVVTWTGIKRTSSSVLSSNPFSFQIEAFIPENINGSISILEANNV